MPREKILIVEDEMLIRELYVKKLSTAGYQVSYATNGQEGLEQTKAIRPHLIISDILMPVLDGYAMIKQLKRDHDLANIPIIIMTNTPSLPNATEARQMGITNALFKVNVTPSQLVSHVQTYFIKHPVQP